MCKLKRNMNTEEGRKFWASFPTLKDSKYESYDEIVLPSLGDAWWEAEKELSPSLLGKTWKELTEEEDLGALAAARKIGENIQYIPKKPDIFISQEKGDDKELRKTVQEAFDSLDDYDLEWLNEPMEEDLSIRLDDTNEVEWDDDVVKKAERVAVYYEPREDGDYVIKISIRDAINRQTESVIDRIGFDVYPSEQDALEDFCVNNWAHLSIGFPGEYICAN